MRNLNLIIFFLVFSSACSVKDKYNPLKAAEISHNLFEAVLKEDLDSVRKWVHITDLSLYNDEGYTVLAKAIQLNNYTISEEIIKSGGKIYQPLQNNIEKSSYTEALDYSEEQIKALLEHEKNRLALVLEKRISDLDFKGALRYSKDNYLPVNLKLPNSQKSTFEFTVSKIDESHQDSSIEQSHRTFQDSIDYLKYLINGEERGQAQILSYHKNVFLRMSSTFKDLDFLSYIINQFNLRHVAHKFNYLTSKDAESISWMSGKVGVLDKFGYYPNLEEIKYQMLNYDVSINSDSTGRSKYMSLVQTLSEYAQAEEKKNLDSYTVMSILRKSREDSNYLSWLIPAIKFWKDQSITGDLLVYDFYAIEVIKSIEEETFVSEDIKRILNHLYSFAPSISNNVEESIKFILSGNFKDYQKLDILNQILEKTPSLPDEILSFAIEVQETKFIEVLLKDRVTLHSIGNQNATVLSIIKSGMDVESIYSMLELLKTKKIPFNTEQGVQAIDWVLNRVIIENERSYQDILSLMLNVDRTPLLVMKKDKVLYYLSKQLENTRFHQNQGWNMIAQILDKLSPDFFEGIIYNLPLTRWSETLRTESEYQTGNLMVSFSWEYILTLFEVYKTYPEQLSLIITLLNNFIENFPADHFSMGFRPDGKDIDTQAFITQGILPLSLLLSIDKDKISSSLSNPSINNEYPVYPLIPDLISWTVLLNNPIFEYYSQEPLFWKSISESLLNSGHEILTLGSEKIKSSKSLVKFVKILVSTEKLREHPILSDQIRKLKINLSDDDKTCALVTKSSEECSRKKCLTVNSNSFSKDKWTNLGTFEALVHLREKTCNGESLSLIEISFIEAYIEVNVSSKKSSLVSVTTQERRIEKTADQFQSKKIKTCSDIPLDQNLENGWIYRNFGGLSFNTNDNIDHSDSIRSFPNPDSLPQGPFAQCSIFEHIEDIHYKAKKIFLHQWSKCAVNLNDENLVHYFKTIPEKIATDLEASNSGVRICRF